MARRLISTILVIVVATMVACPVLAQRFGGLRGKEFSLTVDERERSYVLYVPPEATHSMPLVLVLHGGSGNSRQIESQTHFNELAKQEGFLVCYPQGVEKNWNDGRGVEHIPAHKAEINDVKFLRQVIEAIGKEHDVDRSRIFSTGISNGGFMSHRLAAEASDVISGIAPVVGGLAAPIAKDFHPPHPVSLFVIQGTADPLVPYDGGEVGFRFGKKRGTFISTDAAVAKYLTLNEIARDPVVSKLKDADPNDATTTEASLYPPGKQGARVQVYVINNGGHGWPGGTQYFPEKLVGKVSQDFSATEEIWKFFKACPELKKD